MAFALGFYVILHGDTRIQLSKENGYHFFDDIGLSVVKSLTMAVGELEFSNLPFGQLYGYYTFLLAFVLLVLLAMMNLMNGLAVYDVKEISKKAKDLANKSEVETIYNLVSSA